MLISGCYYRLNMLVGKIVENGLALSSAGYQICSLQSLKLMRDRRLRHSKKFGDRTHAHLSSIKFIHDPYPGCITEHLEKIAQVLKQFFINKTRSNAAICAFEPNQKSKISFPIC